MSDVLKINPIGVIETPFREPADTPIQPSRADGALGKVRIEPQYRAGLRTLGASNASGSSIGFTRRQYPPCW
jgi:tRNA (Thr-GGU) A37 N-methylase